MPACFELNPSLPKNFMFLLTWGGFKSIFGGSQQSPKSSGTGTLQPGVALHVLEHLVVGLVQLRHQQIPRAAE